MDRTQITFTVQSAAASANDVCISLCAPEKDLSASVLLTVDKPFQLVDSLFFSLHSSLENAMFRVREGFEKLVISIRSTYRKFAETVHSMWRKCITPAKIPCFTKRSSCVILRT